MGVGDEFRWACPRVIVTLKVRVLPLLDLLGSLAPIAILVWMVSCFQMMSAGCMVHFLSEFEGYD
jgi:hypothetical protein